MSILNVRKNALLYTVGIIINKVVSFLLLPIYTRYLTTSEYGVIELLELTISVSSIIIGLGSISGAMIRIYHEYDTDKDKKAVVTTTMIVVFCMSTLLGVIAFIFSDYIANHMLHASSYGPLVSLAFVCMLFSTQVETSLVYLRIKERAIFFISYSFFQLIVMVGFNVYFIVIKDLGIWGFVYSKLIAFGGGMVVLWIVVLKETGVRFDPKILKRIIKFGWPLVGASLAFFVIHFSDRFFIAHFSSLEHVGIYSLGYKFGFLVTFLVGEPFGRAWNVQLYSYTKTPGWEKSFAKIFLYFFLALFLVWFGLTIFSHDIVSIIVGPSFRSAAIVIPGVALAYLFREVGDFFRNVLFINKRSKVVSLVAVFCAVINVGCNLLLIQKFGFIGAVWSTILTWLSYMVLLFYFSIKEHTIPYEFKRIFILVFLGGGFYLVNLYYKPFSLVWSIGFHCLLYGVCLYFVWLLRYFDFWILKRNV